jgi:hypothetical protein
MRYRWEILVCRPVQIPLPSGSVDDLLLNVAKGPDSPKLFGFLDQARLPLFKALALLSDRMLRENVFGEHNVEDALESTGNVFDNSGNLRLIQSVKRTLFMFKLAELEVWDRPILEGASFGQPLSWQAPIVVILFKLFVPRSRILSIGST